MPVGAPRRFPLLLIVVAGFLGILYIVSFRAPVGVANPPALVSSDRNAHTDVPAGILTGHAIAPKLGNETAK
jgi:FAD-linked sulfhydryl oxidase